MAMDNFNMYKVTLKEYESQLHSRDEMIYQLKQKMASLIEERDNASFKLQSENEWLRSQFYPESIKEEVEEKPLSLISVETELKVEANTMSKAEPPSDKAVAMASWDLPGVEVCGEMSVVVHSSRYQPVTWEGFGLRLHIEENSLPAGMEQCTLNIKASLAGQYEFPENSSLVSAVFWLRCEPMCKFTKPVTVEIQHCAKSENVDNLKMKFVRALCSQTQLPYTFKELGGDFNRHSSYGVIKVNGFSGMAITQEGTEEREYCSQLFYLDQPSSCQIHFVVTWNLEAHLTVVKEEYKRRGAILNLQKLVDFEYDAITLDIPDEGIIIKDWEIIPLTVPVVTKKCVDNFKVGKLIPHCQLVAQNSREGGEITSVKHRITLIGSKQQGDFIIINLPYRVEEKPLSLISVKTELKQEANTMSKAEPPSDKAVAMASWDLPGVEVCGEMSVVVHSSRYQPVTWEGFGLRLHIQEDSLPAGMEQCTLNIKASLAGQYEFPENSSLVSAVFWLRCEPMCKFTKPVRVEIQHCAKSENVDNLKMKFVRALCSQTQLLYTFKELGGDFNRHSSYGVIQVNGFSGIAVAQKGSEEREYCSQLFYLCQPSSCQIHFVVTWNLEAHLTGVKEEYERKGAILDLQKLVDFESDAITLDIPVEGIIVKDWEVTPKFLPVVTKTQVDNFKEGKSTPCCQLLAEMSKKRKKITSIKHRIILKGSKQQGDFILINLPPGGSPTTEREQTFGDLAAAAMDLGPPPTKRSRQESDQSTTGLTLSSASGSAKPELKDLVKELYNKVSHAWKAIGIMLGLDPGVLDAIKTSENNVSQNCLREMLTAWTKQVDPPPSWSAMAEAIECLGDEQLAHHLRTTYIPSSSTHHFKEN